MRTRVCFRRKGRRGELRGREMMCVVSVEGTEWVRQAAEKVASVVGCRARMS